MKKLIVAPFICLAILFLLSTCKRKTETLFELTQADKTGIDFINTIEETDSFNILTYEYIYNGGGVGVADFNNDGKQDIVFTGNQVPNKIYLNEGDFKFKDITEVASINIPGRWNSGIALADINNDGWMDMYVCATMKPDSLDRRNMLFINNGLNKDGLPTFSERAADYKLDDTGFSVNAAFLDYDGDGDLDLYVLTNQKLKNFPTNYRLKLNDGTSPNNDRLYRNNGDGTFADVSREAGISIEGFGLGLAISDVNLDGWPDIYVSNDYLSNDILFINNRNGTFTNRVAEFIGHQSQFSMGNDAADINNDGLPDIITLDMLPEINARKKTTIGNKSYQTYINNKKYGYEYQYVRNMLHINNGLNKEVKFSEVGQLSGVSQTEWSWSPLFADFDNDGYKDLLITNGFPKDITDKDFANFRADKENIAGTRYLLDSIPVVKISNYAYKNNGDLTFQDVTKSWGLSIPSFSNGAAFADLDNDGDLDYVVNNINDVAFVYRNTLDPLNNDSKTKNFLRVELSGDLTNKGSIGAKVMIYYDHGKMQYDETSIYRGFLSTVEKASHFGLGTNLSVDSLRVVWPDGKSQTVKNVPANQVLSIEYSAASVKAAPKNAQVNVPSLLREDGRATKISYKHLEEDKVDFNLQRTLPHKFSQAGPGISVGDIDNNGLEDFIVGGSSGYLASVFFQKSDGTFASVTKNLKDSSLKPEDEGMLLFDADNDNDLDLYIVSGSVEFADSAAYQDRLYTNDGKGNFTQALTSLPKIKASGSCVRGADFDADGDIDLFVGGRVVPGAYPLPAESYLLRNDNGKFSNVTQEVSKDLRAGGMITDALWTDFDNDGKIDLIVVGEFMAVTFYKNDGKVLSKLAVTGVEQYTGWWNSLTSGDYDKDGDIDYIAGNLGLNNSYQVTKEHPLTISAKDFDGNGSIDPILSCYMRESMDADVKKLYPIHFWEEINSQSTKFRRKYSSFRQYGGATLESLLTPDDLKGALVMQANHMASSYVENLGNGKFKMTPLATPVQFAPVNGMITEDVNDDGHLDVMIIGNDYGNEVFTGRYDALTGLILLGDGKGSFNVVPSSTSGFNVAGDAKALVKLFRKGEDLFLATQNGDSLKVFSSTLQDASNVRVFTPQPRDAWAEFTSQTGQKYRAEFYYGSGYLSQSSRRIRVHKSVKELTVYDSQGKSHKVILEGI